MNNIALVGNPNCGKTTLFNALTGARQKVGNWTGVTTEKKEGKYLKDKTVNIVDLPGLYSLDVRSEDEKAVLNFLESTPPSVIINVVDGTNLERNLYLTLELKKLGIPLVIAISFSDQLRKNHLKLYIEKLSRRLGAPVLEVFALSNENTEKLIGIAKNTHKNAEIARLDELNTPEKSYAYIEELVAEVIKKRRTRAEIFTKKADRILLNKTFGIPVLIAVITLVYYLSISLGGFFGEYISECFDGLSERLNNALLLKGVPEWITSILCEAIIKGIGVVLGFFPQILILFALLAVLEESGYASRMAFLVDRLFASFGLGGKSFIPMLLGCGCTVSGLMATKTIESEGEKRATIFLTPFMPCGAKVAVFSWFSSSILGGSPFFATAMYFLSIFAVVLGGKILHNFKSFNLSEGSFLLEIPTLRVPRIKDTLIVLIEKIKDYITKAGLIIFVLSVLLWALENLGVSGYVGGRVEESFLFLIGDKLKYIFYPIGCSNWQSSVALITGIFAKEAVIESLELLSDSPENLFANGFSAVAFCSFILLSPPCIASIAQAKSQLKSNKWLMIMLLFQTFIGYTVASVINFIGLVIEGENHLILSVIVGIIITISVIKAIKKIKSKPCGNCARCKRRGVCQTRGKRYTT